MRQPLKKRKKLTHPVRAQSSVTSLFSATYLSFSTLVVSGA